MNRTISPPRQQLVAETWASSRGDVDANRQPAGSRRPLPESGRLDPPAPINDTAGMQMTIEIPDELARQLEPERGRLADILRRGLKRSGLPEEEVGGCAMAEEVLTFLARGPGPEEIVAFRPSETSVEQIRELLDKNRRGVLSPQEEAEMDYIGTLNNLFSLIKAHARQRLRAGS
jgi:hypothetical protein